MSLIGSSGLLNDSKVICNSYVLVLFCFFFISALGGGRGRWYKGFFFFFIGWNLFQLPAEDLHWKYNLYAFCIFKACFLNLSRVVVFKEPAQPVTCLKKIYLHFEVPFECHSLDLSSILYDCYIQAPHKSTMLMDAAWHWKLKTLEKLVGLHWGREGNRICVLVCLISK